MELIDSFYGSGSINGSGYVGYYGDSSVTVYGPDYVCSGAGSGTAYSSYGNGSYGSGFAFGSGNGFGTGTVSYGSGSGNGSGNGLSGAGFGFYGNRYDVYVSSHDYNDSIFMKAYVDFILVDKAQILRSEGKVLAFWKSNIYGQPSNGGEGTPAYVGKIEEVKGPLKLCTKHALHATFHPSKWHGTRMWIVALYPPVEFDEDKCGSLKREILAEVPFVL